MTPHATQGAVTLVHPVSETALVLQRSIRMIEELTKRNADQAGKIAQLTESVIDLARKCDEAHSMMQARLETFYITDALLGWALARDMITPEVPHAGVVSVGGRSEGGEGRRVYTQTGVRVWSATSEQRGAIVVRVPHSRFGHLGIAFDVTGHVLFDQGGEYAHTWMLPVAVEPLPSPRVQTRAIVSHVCAKHSSARSVLCARGRGGEAMPVDDEFIRRVWDAAVPRLTESFEVQ